jgi:hypothetical protein
MFTFVDKGSERFRMLLKALLEDVNSEGSTSKLVSASKAEKRSKAASSLSCMQTLEAEDAISLARQQAAKLFMCS